MPNRWLCSADRVDLHPVPRLPRRRSLAALPQRLDLDLQRVALLVVDMQNDFCHPEGWLASIGVDVSAPRASIEPCRELTTAARAAGVPVIWLNWGNRPDRANLPPGVLHVYDPDGSGGGIGNPGGRGAAVLTRGSWGAAVVAELTPATEDICIDKYRMSGFFDTELDSVLRQLAIDTILFAGVNADQCVLATLTDAACLGYNVILVEGAATTSSPDYCLDATVYNVRQCFGFTALSPDVVTMLAGTGE